MNAKTFKEIFLPYHQKLYRIAYRMVENQEDAEDMVQETYIKLWQKRNEYFALNNSEGFAVTVLKNNCLDFLRKTKMKFLQTNDLNIPTDCFITQMENKDEINHIQNILEKLPEQQKKIIQLKHWDNLSNEEIEQVTGLKQGNVKVILSRARKTIKELYQKLEK
jgi:RNA polymerase sigma-70 factor (ECF subfamily)